MTVFNIGSLNVDHVYRLPHIVRPGETLASQGLDQGPGGKGLNQSIALARAGTACAHVGCIGADGTWLKQLLAAEGVLTSFVETVEAATGHAIIQLAEDGENAIVLHPGANHAGSIELVTRALADAGERDLVLLQNETSLVAAGITVAADRGCPIWFNPAPYTPSVQDLPLERLAGLIVNETEACDLAGCDQVDAAIARLHERLGDCTLVCTRGGEGVHWLSRSERIQIPAVRTNVVDTTAAGDTFIGYLLAGLLAGQAPDAACRRACAAAAHCVARAGAADAIPRAAELP